MRTYSSRLSRLILALLLGLSVAIPAALSLNVAGVEAAPEGDGSRIVHT
jgi:hypothetical protein